MMDGDVVVSKTKFPIIQAELDSLYDHINEYVCLAMDEVMDEDEATLSIHQMVVEMLNGFGFVGLEGHNGRSENSE